MREWKKKLLYSYFPFITFVAAILGELILGVMSPIGCYWRGKLIFDVWPLTLLIWIIYWSVKWPAYTLQTYFLFVVCVFCTLFLVIILTIFAYLFNLSQTTRTLLGDISGSVLLGVYFLLAIFQIWARRHWKENQK